MLVILLRKQQQQQQQQQKTAKKKLKKNCKTHSLKERDMKASILTKVDKVEKCEDAKTKKRTMYVLVVEKLLFLRSSKRGRSSIQIEGIQTFFPLGTYFATWVIF